MSPASPEPSGHPARSPELSEVRYSLPELLREIEEERNAPAYAGEKLDQVEIAKLFQKNRPRRANRNRK
jgi:hypothetical protein